MDDFIAVENIVKSYKTGNTYFNALDGVSFRISKGEFVIIAGPSGAGKSTLLNILGGMDTPSYGHIYVNSNDISRYTQRRLTEYRRHEIGFVFQFYNLVQNLTALENVELATQICSDSFSASETLEKVGLSQRKNNFPAQLSGGEQQRIAIARALAKNPCLLLCDEPTGALDYLTGKSILKLLQDTCREYNMTVIVITHNLSLIPMGDRVIRLKNGKIDSMTANASPVPVENIEW